MQLIDTHQHLIQRDSLGYQWTQGIPTLAGEFARDDYDALVAERGVIGTIFMETGVDDADYQREARLVARMVGEGPLPMLGQIAACRPERDDGFDAWIKECGGLNVVGLRRILHTMPDETSQTDSFRRNIRKIGAAGWPVDLCFASRQLGIAAKLVRDCPDVTFVLDHMGTNDMASGGFRSWRESMAALAELPNLWVKFSGITAYVPADAGPGNPIAAVAEAALDLFGPRRLIWGGDWPVVNLGIGLPAWIDMTKALLAHLSGEERACIGSSNARSVYGLAG